MTPRKLALIAVGVLLLAAIVLIWLGSRRYPWPVPLSDIEVAEHWLQCIDCKGPFLQRIHDTQSDMRDSVTRLLRSALLSGPDQVRMQRLERDLGKAWRADSLHRFAPHGPPPTIVIGPGVAFVSDSFAPADSLRDDYLTRYREGFRVRWRGHAAIALGVIRSQTALATLDTALQVIIPQNRGDTALIRMIRRARSDSGILALRHYGSKMERPD